jgi:hypothetical protein
VDQPLGPVGQDSVAVKLFLDPHGGVEVEGHLQAPGDFVSLVHAAGAGATHVDFLEADDVGFMLGDDARDASHIEPAIHADTAVHVVGQDAWHGPYRLERMNRRKIPVKRVNP